MVNMCLLSPYPIFLCGQSTEAKTLSGSDCICAESFFLYSRSNWPIDLVLLSNSRGSAFQKSYTIPYLFPQLMGVFLRLCDVELCRWVWIGAAWCMSMVWNNTLIYVVVGIDQNLTLQIWSFSIYWVFVGGHLLRGQQGSVGAYKSGKTPTWYMFGWEPISMWSFLIITFVNTQKTRPNWIGIMPLKVVYFAFWISVRF